MAEPPKLVRDLDLLGPRRPRVLRSKFALLFGTALAGTNAAPVSIATTPSIAAVPARRQEEGNPPPLILSAPDPLTVLAGHSSHSSHASHSSHYSGSTGSSATPSTSPTTPSTPPSGSAVAPATVPAATAAVTVTSTPSVADIEVDGKFLGSTRSVIHLAPGTHQIVISKSGYVPWTRSLELAAGNEISVNAELVPALKTAPKAPPSNQKK